MNRKIFALGILGGLWSVISPGGIFIGLLALFIGFLFHRMGDPGERRYVVALFAVGFIARVVLSLGLDVASGWVEGQWPAKRGVVHEWDVGIVDKTREFIRMGDSDF
jgi:hypothetical protein